MIDPKQKAIDIRFKYWHEQDLMPEQANECAKIAVQYIIDASPTNPLKGGYIELYSDMIDEAREFWQEVLNELNKM